MQQEPPCIAVLGPTASGKTALAVEIARAFDGEVVSCDSVQIYRRLDIGSAKPDPAERSAVPHHLIDLFEPDFRVDVGIYKSRAESAIRDILARGKLPVLCGGTGMYFNSLFYGLFDAPSRDEEYRKSLEERADREGTPALYAELSSIDPETAGKVTQNDRRRIIRALEVYRVAGIPISALREKNEKLPLHWLLLATTMDRAELYARIERRVDAMIRSGLVEETRGIVRDFGGDAFALGSIGYRHSLKLLRGEWAAAEMEAALKQDTRHYAKRQYTWFRKIDGVRWHDVSGGFSGALADTKAFLQNAEWGAA
jgi:tRNA dimethylallyltransferase